MDLGPTGAICSVTKKLYHFFPYFDDLQYDIVILFMAVDLYSRNKITIYGCVQFWKNQPTGYSM